MSSDAPREGRASSASERPPSARRAWRALRRAPPAASPGRNRDREVGSRAPAWRWGDRVVEGGRAEQQRAAHRDGEDERCARGGEPPAWRREVRRREESADRRDSPRTPGASALAAIRATSRPEAAGRDHEEDRGELRGGGGRRRRGGRGGDGEQRGGAGDRDETADQAPRPQQSRLDTGSLGEGAGRRDARRTPARGQHREERDRRTLPASTPAAASRASPTAKSVGGCHGGRTSAREREADPGPDACGRAEQRDEVASQAIDVGGSGPALPQWPAGGRSPAHAAGRRASSVLATRTVR